MSETSQSYKNHAKTVPIYHYFALPVSGLNAVWLIVHAVTRPSLDTAIAALMGVALVVMFLMARVFALTVQDRVIRLEMRLRLGELLPPDLKTRRPSSQTLSRWPPVCRKAGLALSEFRWATPW